MSYTISLETAQILQNLNGLGEKDEFSSLVDIPIPKGALGDAIAAHRENEEAVALREAAGAVIEVLDLSKKQIQFFVNKVREHRRAEQTYLRNLNMINHAIDHGNETNNYVPLLLLFAKSSSTINADYGSDPSVYGLPPFPAKKNFARARPTK